MTPLRICFVTSEVAPFVKAGGLADVSSALPAHLHKAGHDVRVFVPFYAIIDGTSHAFTLVEALRDITLHLGSAAYTFSVFKSPLPESTLDVYFLRCPALFGRGSLYSQDPDEHRRFLLLSRGAIECCQRMGWAPHVLHCHDWQTAMIPAYLKSTYSWDQLFKGTKTVLTIHNLGYQGVFSSTIAGDLGPHADLRLLHQGDLRDGRVNFLKTGILHADFLTTVSPTYAREIQTDGHGVGLDSHLRARSGSLVGILNGVDYKNWNPSTDPFIAHHYAEDSLDRKDLNKEDLLKNLGLHHRPGVPVVGVVSRLAHQKGLDLLWDPLPAFLSHRDFRFAVLGSGEPKYEDYFRGLMTRFPGKVCFYSGHSEKLAHMIEAGSDMFLMPSRYEPCGLNQMYSLKYGTVPIVRKTGGLADTVRHYDPFTGEGNGIVFEHFTAEGLSWALDLALNTYNDRETWRRIMRNGMAADFSWDVQGRLYEDLYRRLTSL